MYRQGDVLLVPIDAIPADAEPVALEQGRVILAHGEVTGHHHSFAGDGSVALLASGDERYLRVDRTAALTHQEHTAIDVPPGTYRVIRQREYQPAAPRWVAD